MAGAVASALAAFLTTWHMLNLPSLAWSTDVSRLDAKQVDIAIEVYQTKIRSLLTTPAFSDPNSPSARAWEEELRRAREQQSAAERRKFEISK